VGNNLDFSKIGNAFTNFANVANNIKPERTAQEQPVFGNKVALDSDDRAFIGQELQNPNSNFHKMFNEMDLNHDGHVDKKEYTQHIASSFNFGEKGQSDAAQKTNAALNAAFAENVADTQFGKITQNRQKPFDVNEFAQWQVLKAKEEHLKHKT